MFVDCAYFGNGEFYGLDISQDDRELWDYHSDRYVDFVIDCLNENFYSIAVGCFPIVSAESSEPTILNNLVVEAIRERYKRNPYIVEDLVIFWEESLPNTLENYEIVTADLLKLDIAYYQRAVDAVYLDSSFSELTPRQKYYAFRAANSSNKLTTDRYEASVTMDRISKNPGNTAELPKKFRDDFDEEMRVLDKPNKYVEICKIISTYRDRLSINIGPVYKFPTLHDTFVFLFHEMLKDEYTVKRCKHCGRYFVPSHKGEQYCDMPSPEFPAKDCQEYVKYQNYLSRSHIESVRLHKQIYNQKANKVKRSGNIVLQAELKRFLEQSEKWRSDVRDGVKLEEDYVKWLRNVKENGL